MNGFIAILAIITFIGGLLLLGYATSVPGAEIAMFAAGIGVIALSIGLPIHLLDRFD